MPVNEITLILTSIRHCTLLENVEQKNNKKTDYAANTVQGLSYLFSNIFLFSVFLLENLVVQTLLPVSYILINKIKNRVSSLHKTFCTS